MCPKICHLFHSSEALTIAVPSEGYHIQLTPKYSWPDYHRHFLKRKNSELHTVCLYDSISKKLVSQRNLWYSYVVR